ncbi:Flp pilus assembly protein TadG [Sphingomonas sp. UYAg733]
MSGIKAIERVMTRGFMSRLAHDVRGNTLAMMAIALFPICGIVGSGIDTARLYVVKVRLQQACDAGVLAGRKSIVNSTAPLDVSPAGQAQTFFKNNFKNGWMRTNTTAFTPVKTTDNQVSGTASVNVPMTIMKMFGAADVALNVACQARYDVADTDIMFVLDTTGSMAGKPDGSGAGGKYAYTREDGTTGYASGEASSDSKIAGVRAAVLNFYDTIDSTADPSTHIRYGFVPYSVTVNAGAAIRSLNPSYLVDKWTYNTREPAGIATNTVENNDTVWNTATVITDKVASTSCTVGVVRTPANGYVVAGSGIAATATATRVTKTYQAQTNNKAPGTCTVKTEKLKVTWNYLNKELDVSQLKTGAATVDRTRYGGGTITWPGCIEERQTTFGATSFNQSALPPDLDPDLTPSSDDTKWKPALPELSYYRGNNTSVYNAGSSNTASSDVSGTGTTLGKWLAANYNGDGVACPKAAKRLSVMTRGEVATYVSSSGDLRPSGYTYHDTGMIWGTRFLAPKGPFGADTAAWPNRNEPNRFIVFMTDGDMNNVVTAYSLYGIEYYDKRVSGLDNDEAYHNARFVAECTAAGSRGITVYVVAFGTALNQELKDCAKYGKGKAFTATDTASLNTVFQDIAKQIALLRISQ